MVKGVASIKFDGRVNKYEVRSEVEKVITYNVLMGAKLDCKKVEQNK